MGCDDDSPALTSPPVVSLTLRPDSARLTLGDSTDFDVVFRGERSDSLDAAWDWSTQDATIAVVNRTGTLVARSVGETLVRADRFVDGTPMSAGAVVIVYEGGGR